MRENTVQKQIMLELCKRGCIVHREQSGLFYTVDGRPVKIGVNGKSDLLGHTPDGKIFYIETKCTTGGKHSEDQIKFINAMRSSGARAGFAKTVEEALEIICS